MSDIITAKLHDGRTVSLPRISSEEIKFLLRSLRKRKIEPSLTPQINISSPNGEEALIKIGDIKKVLP